MKKLNIQKLVKNAKVLTSAHSPEILMGVGIAGMIGTAILAVTETPKALEKIDEKKKEIYNEADPIDMPAQAVPENVKLSNGEIVKATWKCYIPAGITCAISIACLIGSNKIKSDRFEAKYTALMTAYNLSQSTLSEYKDAVLETVGEKKVDKIQDAVEQKHLESHPIKPEPDQIIVTGNGTVRCYDIVSDRRFYASKNAIESAVNKVDRDIRDGVYASLNELYAELNLPETYLGSIVGWNIDKGYIDVVVKSMVDNDGVPVLTMDFLNRPYANYDNLY